MSADKRFELDTMEQSNLQMSFALACRILADINGCPKKNLENAYIPDCEVDVEDCPFSRKWECWQGCLKDIVKSEQVCRICGCTEYNACQPYGCSWVEEDLCSSCALNKEGLDGNRTDKND